MKLQITEDQLLELTEVKMSNLHNYWFEYKLRMKNEKCVLVNDFYLPLLNIGEMIELIEFCLKESINIKCEEIDNQGEKKYLITQFQGMLYWQVYTMELCDALWFCVQSEL